MFGDSCYLFLNQEFRPMNNSISRQHRSITKQWGAIGFVSSLLLYLVKRYCRCNPYGYRKVVNRSLTKIIMADGLRLNLPASLSFSKLHCYNGLQHKALLSTLIVFTLYAFVVMSSAAATLGDIPAEVLYANVNYKPVLLHTTATEACAYLVEGDPTYSNPIGVEINGSNSGDCYYTLTPPGQTPRQVGPYQNWFVQRLECPTGYKQIVTGTCSLIKPNSFPKYPVLSCETNKKGAISENLTGNPIYTAYGNKLQRETDYPGMIDSSLGLERIYNSTPAVSTASN